MFEKIEYHMRILLDSSTFHFLVVKIYSIK